MSLSGYCKAKYLERFSAPEACKSESRAYLSRSQAHARKGYVDESAVLHCRYVEWSNPRDEWRKMRLRAYPCYL